MATSNELMIDVQKSNLVLPEFQREYVWTREQAKQLMVSLFKGYPVGSLLFWKTDNPPDLKNIKVSKSKVGTTNVMLDGQQRLTTLYLFTQDDIPPFYTEGDIRTDPRDLFFDLETGDFQYYQAQKMRNNPTWVPVTRCFKGGEIDVFKIAEAKSESKEDQFRLANKYNTNLTTLCNILTKVFPIQTVPPEAQIDQAIDVFDRVNSLGTKLSDAELALAHICGKWPQARKEMKRKIADLESRKFYFDLTFMVRCLTAVAQGRAIFETIHGAKRAELLKGWDQLVQILDYLVALLPKHAHVHSTEDLSTTNVLVPVVVYLARNTGHFEGQKEMRRFIYWMYAALLWGRYTGQTDQRLDHDVAICKRFPSPWSALINTIIDQRGRIEVTASDLEGRGTQHPLYRMSWITCKANGGIDWFNGSPLDMVEGRFYAIHSHHIFPTSVLYEKGGYDPDNHLHKQIVNEIANRAFLTSHANIGLGNKEPAEYLPGIERKYPDSLKKQFVPLDSALWRTDNFENFLVKRREMLAKAINEYMHSLLAEIEVSVEPTAEELLTAGESTILEYKTSLRWDFRTQQVNKRLERSVAKTVAAFMNSEGGTLLIGVEDSGVVQGIESDLRTLSRQDRDAYEQALRQTLINHLGIEAAQWPRVLFGDIKGKTICSVNVEPSTKPVFMCEDDAKAFYIRVGNTTRALDPEETHNYISTRWES